MFLILAKLQWKAFFRSANLGRSLGLKILMGLMVGYFMLVFLLLGVGLYPLLKEQLPHSEPLLVVNRFVLLWLLAELVLRFFLQTLPVISVKPLMVTSVARKQVVHYVLIRSFLSVFNIFPLLVILPFAIFTWVKSEFSPGSILGWGITIYALDLIVNFINFLIKKRFANRLQSLIPFVLVIIILGILDYLEIFSASELFARALGMVIELPILAIIPLFLVGAIYLVNVKVMHRHFYLDDGLKAKESEVDTRDFLWTRKLGNIAPYLQLDLKLIWRNKRPRTAVFMSVFLCFYGLIFYTNDTYQAMPAIFIFVGIFMTGIFMINFGQFIPAWDSSYYSMMMTQNIPMKKYLFSKSLLMMLSLVVITILTTPYLYFGREILLINVVCAVYNAGVNIPVLLFAGSYNKKRIDLENSMFMNYQGTGTAQWIVGLPLICLPVFLFWLIDVFFSFEVAIGFILVLGILGLLFRSSIMNLVEQAYLTRKYEMIDGFKQTGE